ncbi:MAG: hypothetical protein LBF38_03155 [Deltaproteobacteria bacterium]|jgi:hypothetical protein|nr:hypothetical protein [Deltaproteobacteria bacterium]
MSVDSISQNPNLTQVQLESLDAAVDKVTLKMLLAFFEKENGKEWKAKLDELQEDVGVAWNLFTKARIIPHRPIMTRAETKAQKVLDNQFAAELSVYFEKNGLTFHGGADPTNREWAANVEELEAHVNNVLDVYNNLLRDIKVFIATYESLLELNG